MYVFGSDRSPWSADLGSVCVCLSVCVCTLCIQVFLKGPSGKIQGGLQGSSGERELKRESKRVLKRELKRELERELNPTQCRSFSIENI